jgi:hypothetical protein
MDEKKDGRKEGRKEENKEKKKGRGKGGRVEKEGREVTGRAGSREGKGGDGRKEYRPEF